VQGLKDMRIATMLDQLIGYFSAAAARIFGPNHDEYPAVGVQPFEGEVDREKHGKNIGHK
jgi:hypothetical protein